jgi:hypothetical protein
VLRRRTVEEDATVARTTAAHVEYSSGFATWIRARSSLVMTSYDESSSQNVPPQWDLTVAAVPPSDGNYLLRKENDIFKKLNATDVR